MLTHQPYKFFCVSDLHCEAPHSVLGLGVKKGVPKKTEVQVVCVRACVCE